MTPKQQLGRDIGKHVLGKNRRSPMEQCAATELVLKPYAIGRWVPVEERLPEFDDTGTWEGYAQLTNSILSVEAGQWDESLLEHATYWLELDLPEVEG